MKSITFAQHDEKSFYEGMYDRRRASDEKNDSLVFYCSDETIISNPQHGTYLIRSDRRPQRRVSRRMTKQKERQLHQPSVE